MESQGDRILRSGNWPERSKDTEREGRRSTQLTSSQKCKGSTKILGISQLL